MLDEQTLKKFQVVVRRKGEGSFLSFLSFELSLLLTFSTASCCFSSIDCELNDKLGLKAVGSKVTVLFVRHDR